MLQKILGLLLLVGAAFLAWNSLKDFDSKSVSKSAAAPQDLSFSAYVSKDLESLRQQGVLPKEWAEIQHVAYQMHNAFQKELIGSRKIAAIPENPSGRFKMEIEFIDVPDEKEPALILQMSMFDIETNNKVWELGRTYPLQAFLKKPAESKPAPQEQEKEKNQELPPSGAQEEAKEETKSEND